MQQRVSVSLVAAELILSLLWTASHSCSLIYRFAASIINFAVLSKHLQPQLSDRSSASDRSRWPARLETFPFLGFGCCCKSTPNGHGAWCITRDWPPIPLMLLHCLRADTDYLRLLSPRVVLILVVKLGSDPSATTEPRRRQASLFASPPSGRMDVVNQCFELATELPKLQALVYDILPFGGRCRKAVLGVCELPSLFYLCMCVRVQWIFPKLLFCSDVYRGN